MSKFQYNLVVIGAGSAGLVSSLVAARAGAKVALVEQNRMGGDCLYTGCVPSKTLIASAKVAHQIRHADQFGIAASEPIIDFEAILNRVKRVIAGIEPHDSKERYEKLGVECIGGTAILASPHEVQVDGRNLSTKSVIVATGSTPSLPPIKGLEEQPHLTSDTVWNLESLPGRITVLGGGPIGCELAQAFARFGSQVTLVELASRLLPLEDERISETIRERFHAEGIRVLCSANVNEVGPASVHLQDESKSETVPHDALVVATGRRPYTSYLNVAANGIELSQRGHVAVNAFLQSTAKSVYGCGDVIGPYQYTHTAGDQAYYATINAIARPFFKIKYPNAAIPHVVFTDPEVARVGLTEVEATGRYADLEATEIPLNSVDRSRTDEQTHGFVRVLTRGNRDTVVGASIVAPNAGELIEQFVAAMSHGVGLKKLSSLIYAYPTMSESIGRVARAWRQRELSPRRIALARSALALLR